MKIDNKPIIDKYGLCLNEYKNNKNNANVYYKRAIGKFPEMETSKAMAKIIKKILINEDKILDVGCGSGHFLRSLRRIIKKKFFIYRNRSVRDIFKKSKISLEKR